MAGALAAYALRRTLLMIPTFLVISFLGFAITVLAPGDPVDLYLAGGLAAGQAGISTQKLADKAKAEQELRRELGLDRPLVVQYADWLRHFVTGDLGRSYKDKQPVWEKIRARLPVTVGIEILALFVTYLLAVPLGIYSATRPGSRFDQVSTVTIFLLYSMPSFWIAVLLLVFFCGGGYFAWFPPGGLRSLASGPDWSFAKRTGDLLHHLALPLFVTTLGSYTEISRYLRSSMLDNARQDFVRTARAKGLGPARILLHHVLRNALMPVITVLALHLGTLLGGTVLVEYVFNYPGLSGLLVEAVNARDYPIVEGVVLVISVLFVVLNLAVDLLYAVLDPRVRTA